MSGILKVGGSELINDNGGSGALQWGSGVPSGSIVQVQHTQYGTNASETGNMTSLINNTNYVLQASGNTSGGSASGILDVNITPRIYGSKIWLQCHWMGELDQDRAWDCVFFFWRNTTKLASGVVTGGSPTIGRTGISLPTRTYHDADDNTTPEILNMQYFDTHGQTESEVNTGTQITYKLGFASSTSFLTQITTNRVIAFTDEVGVSSICAIELAP